MSEKVQLSISGMSCAACVRRVEQGLADLDGVSSAAVNFATEKATVEYDPAALSMDQMAAKVKVSSGGVCPSPQTQASTEPSRALCNAAPNAE